MIIPRMNEETAQKLEADEVQETEETNRDSSFKRAPISNRITGVALLTVLFALYCWLG
jgi:hypothetical protein